MASAKILELLAALRRGTADRRVTWDDLADEEMFRTQLGGGLIRIGKTAEEDVLGRKGYTLWLLGHTGTVAAEVNFFPGEPGYDLIEDLYSSARLVARGGEFIIDNIIRELNPASP